MKINSRTMTNLKVNSKAILASSQTGNSLKAQQMYQHHQGNLNLHMSKIRQQEEQMQQYQQNSFNSKTFSPMLNKAQSQ